MDLGGSTSLTDHGNRQEHLNCNRTPHINTIRPKQGPSAHTACKYGVVDLRAEPSVSGGLRSTGRKQNSVADQYSIRKTIVRHGTRQLPLELSPEVCMTCDGPNLNSV